MIPKNIGTMCVTCIYRKLHFSRITTVNLSFSVDFCATAYFGCEDHYLYAIDSQTGKQKWRFDAKAEVVTSPLITNGQVYFGSLDGHLYAINAKTGRQKWKFLTGDMINSSPVESNGVIYFGSNDGYLYAVALDK